MFRLLILSCLVSWAAAQCGPNDNRERTNWFWPGGNGDDDDYNDRTSEDGAYGNRGSRNLGLPLAAIARKLRSAGDLMDTFCAAHSNRNLREVYAVEHFKLTVPLAEFSAENILVKVQNRVVLVHARDCESEYAAVRMLPDVVDASRASWALRGGVLTVLFPYNITPDTNLQSRCGRKPNTGVLVVPQSSADTPNQPDYDLLLGDPEFRRAILRYLKRHEGNRGPTGGDTEDGGTNEYVDDDKE